MRFHPIGDFARGQEHGLPACAAVAIAPASDVDICQVGPHVLAPGGMVPFGPTVVPVRGIRTDDVPIATGLVLALYDDCDAWRPQGPRSTRVHSARVTGYGVTQATAVRGLRIPFSGRPQAAIAVRRAPVEPAGLTLVVRGVRYHSRDELRAVPAAPPPYYVEVSSTLLAFGPSPIDGKEMAEVVYVGGAGDAQEAFDELELFFYGSGGPASVIYVQATVDGERGTW